MNTQIFPNYKAFTQREDKSINGVSPEFAEQHPDYVKENKSNLGCWNCTGCKKCIDCVDCIACTRCTICNDSSFCKDSYWLFYCHDCLTCLTGVHCHSCIDCINCKYCHHCVNSMHCFQCINVNTVAGKTLMNYAISLKNPFEDYNQKIHEKVLFVSDQMEKDESNFNTNNWRINCLRQAYKEAFEEMTAQSNERFAAMLIYYTYSNISVHPRLLTGTHAQVIEDMRYCVKNELDLPF